MKNITRRDFVKGMAAAGAGVGLVTILPNGVITSADAAWGWPTNKPSQNVVTNWWGSILESWLPKIKKDGIYIEGSTENMNNKTYTLEFVHPVKLVAVVDKEIQTEGTWCSSNKHLVSVTPDGTVVMRDGVGGYDVDVTWTLGDKTFTVTFHTGQTAGAHAIDVDSPITRGAFMMRVAKYFGWPHYNAVMDDGTDIDEEGQIMETERVRNYHDVNGDSEYVKAIESALDMGVLYAESHEDSFYPMSDMTREDAAVILVKAFNMESLDVDYIKGFADAKDITPACYDALNTLVGRNFMRGRTNNTLNPLDGITDTEARIIIENIDRKVTAPVWAMPTTRRKFVRVRPEWMTATKDATIYWRCKVDKYSHAALKGLFVQDRGVGVYIDTGWSDWFEYHPGWSTDPCFGLNNNKDLPYDALWFLVDVECYAVCEGKETSPVTSFMWRIERPAWHDFAHDVLHEGDANFPTVHRYFDNFQAAAYYIEGSKMGILYDGLMPTNTSISLLDRVREVATKPFVFVMGHNHGDHNGCMPNFGKEGMDIYVCDRVCNSIKGGKWSMTVYNKEYTSGNVVYDSEESGTYDPEKVHLIDEGFVFDLGNCKFEVVHLPGHEDGSILLYSRETGLLFSSDIYAVNRYWVADNTGATGVKQDLLLSLHQQLMDIYHKDGGVVKELYTGHNRIGCGGDYLIMWEQCLQKFTNYGGDALTDNRRGNGSLMSQDGNEYETLNWTGLTQSGTVVRQEYTGVKDGKKFIHLEIDRTGAKAVPESGLCFDYKTNAHLSNISFADAELVGHDFDYKYGQKSAGTLLEDGRGKYVIPNKFVPWDFDYEVKIGKNQTKVTFTPVAMSECITGMTVNGKAHSSRCPVKVDTNGKTKIVVTGPDGETTCTYTLTFVK